MQVAAVHGHLEVMQWLHEQDPSLIDQANKNQFTTLQVAAFQEKIPILEVFIKEIKNNL